MARDIDEAWIEAAIERYHRIDALRVEFEKAIKRVEVTVSSPDGLVEVVVAGDGTIKDVRIDGGMQGRSSAQLSRSVRDAVSAAADAAAWARQKLHADTFGDYPSLT